MNICVEELYNHLSLGPAALSNKVLKSIQNSSGDAAPDFSCTVCVSCKWLYQATQATTAAATTTYTTNDDNYIKSYHYCCCYIQFRTLPTGIKQYDIHTINQNYFLL